MSRRNAVSASILAAVAVVTLGLLSAVIMEQSKAQLQF
jgi:hypothetical protein